MRTLILILTCIGLNISLNCHAQKKFEVKGTMQTVSYHQGGARLPDYMRHPQAMPNYTMYLVKYIDSTTQPIVLKKVTSDSLGQFNFSAPEGKYGFLLNSNKNDLKAGMYLPQTGEDSSLQWSNTTGLGDTGYDRYWYLDCDGPFEVGKNKTNQVSITYHNVSVCYKCP